MDQNSCLFNSCNFTAINGGFIFTGVSFRIWVRNMSYIFTEQLVGLNTDLACTEFNFLFRDREEPLADMIFSLQQYLKIMSFTISYLHTSNK